MNRSIPFPSGLFLITFFLLTISRINAQQWQRIDALPAGQTTAIFATGDTLFAAGLNKIYFTTDNGLSWDSTAVIDPDLDFIEAVLYREGRLYVATVSGGVFSSANGGQSWQPDNNGLTGLGALDMSSLESRGDSLYAGTYGAGVFVKKISANSAWSAYNIGMPWGNIESLTNIDGELFAGSGTTTIPFLLHRPGLVELTVFDAAGALVRTVWHGEKPAGSHQLDFDAQNLPAGLYGYRLTTEAGVASRWMVLIK